ncbi:binding--dependent transport system inner membrane component family protein [Bacillus atrophaeus subsp. globigii]|uniref:Glycine betaine/carnitine/choline/choline sulfate ABC transporter permease n=1 Tax=Bacillus atrophaeus (strain 1942) TaxID=720555 RepID=A0ABM5M113_BACA1|nr:ABC transporter permease [Bacillus atrophaeus]AMR61411.1 choline ABC transporter permease [Bacillus subtilis subsp. globigii]ADP33891.1 glycine betaine/carnitine/choline/choline sulfate ABC transporter permease [Bacillus atrophaeus 1942]AIK46385.1 binding--dependent transport system inner membrane component family protein [Bacillus atrophaeus subsp. globigii]KAA6447433.1 ABC transporter permease [Bacillus atrophaeus]KFK82182.1 binding--dependent transport system inner membrane component fam
MSQFIDFLQTNGGEMLYKTWEHLYISIIAVILGILVAVPLGVVLARMKKGAGTIIGIVNIVQTLPSLAILAFFIPLLGVGKVPAIVALFFYSVLPILRNTYTGIQGVNKNLLESGKGIGMTGWEQIRLVELPLAVPIIMAGIRTSTIYLIGWATLASFIGGGGLGDYIFIGLNLYQPEYIIGGAVPVTILAIIIDYLLAVTERKVTPKGLQGMKEVS